VFLVALAFVLLAMHQAGMVDLEPGNAKVIDGDSLRVGDAEIRLNGIDAPEYRQTCKDNSGEQYSCGKRAADVLRRLVKGQQVSCRSLEADRYGRAVSECKAGTTDLNREMVRLGWAVAYRRHSANYAGAEREAKAERRGIWAGSFEEPEAWRARNHPVEGNAAGLDAQGAEGD
jgi:endonuclease YncB( thermonuclease family)